MANPHKGEAVLKIGGRDWTLAFTINAMCEIEYLLDQSTDQILRSLAGVPALHVVRGLLWGGLRTHHPDIDLKTAGDLMEGLGGTAAALESIGAALVAAFPEAKADDLPDPRTGATAGRGRRSSRSGSKSARTPTPSGEPRPD